MPFNEELRQIPILRLIVPFIIGIVLQIHFQLPTKYLFEIIIFFLVVLFFIWYLKKISQNYNYRWIFGFLVYVILFLTGIKLVSIESSKSSYVNIEGKESVVIANIVKAPIEKPKSIKAVVELKAIRQLTDEQWIRPSRLVGRQAEKAIIYFQKDCLSEKLELGDEIIFKPYFQDIKTPANPGEFDYKRYLAFRHIHQQAYLQSGKWKLINKNQGNVIQLYANKLRNILLQIYNDYGIKDKEFSVVSALTLGYKEKLDEEIKTAYSSSGAMHILAVSGLHVGIVYLVLNYLLFFLVKFRSGKFIKAIIIILLLWSYAFITGLSPSVMRATIMFCFIIVGTSLRRPTNIYNTLAASAFLLLLINPYIIMEVGFQLSYLAVISIVYFQPRIYSLFEFNNWFIDKIWALFTVSFAAQLGTFPVGLFYFHQFPNYFLITNMIVIPYATIIIYLAILLMSFSFVYNIASIIALVLNYTLKGLNYSVSFIEQMPYSTTSDVSINLPETFIIYLLIICFAMFFTYKRVRYLYWTLACIITILSMNIEQVYTTAQQRKFIVYNIKGVSAYNFIDGTDNILFSSVQKNNEHTLMYNVRNNWIYLGVPDAKIIYLESLNEQSSAPPKPSPKGRASYSLSIDIDNQNLFYKNNFINFHNKRFLLLQDNKYQFLVPEKKSLDIDYVILSGNIQISISDIMTLYNVKQIIIDSSNSYWIKEKWLNESKNYDLRCYSVSDNGAFQVDL